MRPPGSEWERFKAMPGVPTVDQFDAYEDYSMALAVFVSDVRAEERQTQRQAMGAMKSFAVGVARIATIIVVVIVALSVLGFGGVALWENWTKAQETARNAPLEALKTWPLITVEALGGVKLTLSTKWREEELLYQFTVAGYPPVIAAAMDGKTDNSTFSLDFLDKDGFQAAEVDVLLTKMVRSTTSNMGKYAGLSVNARTVMSAETYRRAASWTIAWQGFADPKPPVPVMAPSQPFPAAGVRRTLNGEDYVSDGKRFILEPSSQPTVDRLPSLVIPTTSPRF